MKTLSELLIPLALACAICTAAYPSRSEAASVLVTNCNDAGPGSLRAAAASAASGDTIDLRGLTCGRITLATGEIELPQDDLTLLGSGRQALTVSGNQITRVFNHSGRGTLRIERISLAYGYIEGPSLDGACILSTGRVELRHARVHHCLAHLLRALEIDGDGAGIYAGGSILLSYSSVFASRFDGWRADETVGGGLFTNGRVVMDHSQVYDNVAGSEAGGHAGAGATLTYSIIQNNLAAGSGGGLGTSGDVFVNKSTISGNQAYECAGLCIGGYGSTIIVDSTISGNAGTLSALDSTSISVEIYNSTIVRNSEPGPTCMGAVHAGTPGRVRLQSTIAAANTCGSMAGPDIGALADPFMQVSGSHNLIGMSLAPVPSDTISAAPRLAPLAWNGGPTRTHALLSDSPAINHGNNVRDLAYDQRGPGFPRVKGTHPDIGAYEY